MRPKFGRDRESDELKGRLMRSEKLKDLSFGRGGSVHKAAH